MKFDDLNPLRSFDTEEIVTLENGPKSFGTFEKRAPEVRTGFEPVAAACKPNALTTGPCCLVVSIELLIYADDSLLIACDNDPLGVVSCVVRWKRPYDDGDAVVSGYQLYVDGNHFQKPLPLSALEAALKVRIVIKCF